jgi:hypothetical protein
LLSFAILTTTIVTMTAKALSINKPQQEHASSKLRDASKESAMAEMPSEVRSAAKERISETRSLARNELHPSREPRARNPQFKLNLHMMKLPLIVTCQ